MKTFFTSQARKNIIVLKYNAARQPGSESMARYIINTQPSCEAAWYTVKKLVTANIYLVRHLMEYLNTKLHRIYKQNSSNPLKPMIYRDSSNFIHFIPVGHWYPELGSREQNVSGIARLLIVITL